MRSYFRAILIAHNSISNVNNFRGPILRFLLQRFENAGSESVCAAWPGRSSRELLPAANRETNGLFVIAISMQKRVYSGSGGTGAGRGESSAFGAIESLAHCEHQFITLLFIVLMSYNPRFYCRFAPLHRRLIAVRAVEPASALSARRSPPMLGCQQFCRALNVVPHDYCARERTSEAATARAALIASANKLSLASIARSRLNSRTRDSAR